MLSCQTNKAVLCVAGVTVAAKGYFDALVKLGELASISQGSKELGKFYVFINSSLYPIPSPQTCTWLLHALSV